MRDAKAKNKPLQASDPWLTGPGGVLQSHPPIVGPFGLRSEQPPVRRYVSVFGELAITRYVYDTRETQKHEVIPLDALLRLDRPVVDADVVDQAKPAVAGACYCPVERCSSMSST